MTKERAAPFDADFDTMHGYRPHEIVMQIKGSRCFMPVTVEGFPAVPGGLALFGTRRNETDPAFNEGEKSDYLASVSALGGAV